MQYIIMNNGKPKADGTLTVKFRYYQDGILKTVPAATVPKFKTESEIIAHMPKLEAKYDAQKQEKLRRESWMDKYHNFDAIKEKYTDKAKERAPRSYKAKISYLENYVFYFFLTERGLDNMNLWYTHFEEFRKWLKKVKKFSNKKKTLALNTINHCIIELNLFLEFCAKQGDCMTQPSCDLFADAKIHSRKGLDSVFTPDEEDDVYDFLTTKDQKLADAFWLLLRTGTRINEFRGISPNNVRNGLIPQGSLNKLISDSGFSEYKCFIFFSAQVDNKSTNRNENGQIDFIPLKTKKTMGPENTRYIPVWDARAYSIIKKIMKETQDLYRAEIYGTDLAQYSFFYDDVSSTILNLALAEFYKLNDKKYPKPKTCHDCRHTYATWLGGYDITGTLQEYICGHQKESATRYNHLKSQLKDKTVLKEKDVFSGW